jgi:hypothetical protein
MKNEEPGGKLGSHSGRSGKGGHELKRMGVCKGAVRGDPSKHPVTAPFRSARGVRRQPFWDAAGRSKPRLLIRCSF